MNNRLSRADALLVQYLLEDPTIRGILVDNDKKEVYSSCSVGEDGSITFGKTCVKWWNRLIGDERTISFNEFAMKVASAISGQKNNTNQKILNGLLGVIATKGIQGEDYSYVIDQLLIATKFGMKNSPLSCKVMGIDSGDPTEGDSNTNEAQKINIHIDPMAFSHKFALNPFGETINVKGHVQFDQIDQQYWKPQLKRISIDDCV